MIKHDGKPIPGWDAPLPWWRRWKIGFQVGFKELYITLSRKF